MGSSIHMGLVSTQTLALIIDLHCCRQMSAWLGRPHLIDQKTLTFKFPTLTLDKSLTEPNHISPFTHIALQAKLAYNISNVMGETQFTRDLSAEQVLRVEAECDKFVSELPKVFDAKSPDTTLDEKYPHFTFQRFQIHAVIYMTKLDPLKPYITRDPKNPQSTLDDSLRNMGIEMALKLLELTRTLFEFEFPINAKFHFVVFCLFDTATVLCSAIIHDIDHVLPHREDAMDAVESALDMLHQLSLTTQIGASSYKFLFKLVQAAPVISRYSPLRKRHRVGTSTSNAKSSMPPPMQPVSASPSSTHTPATSTIATTEALPNVPVTDDLSFDLDEFLAQNPFGGSQLDIGGLEQIWDWNDLNLDPFLNQETQNPPF